MATAADREIHVLGKNEWGNREVVVVEAGEDTDLPADTEYPYTQENTQFPYEIPA